MTDEEMLERGMRLYMVPALVLVSAYSKEAVSRAVPELSERLTNAVVSAIVWSGEAYDVAPKDQFSPVGVEVGGYIEEAPE